MRIPLWLLYRLVLLFTLQHECGLKWICMISQPRNLICARQTHKSAGVGSHEACLFTRNGGQSSYSKKHHWAGVANVSLISTPNWTVWRLRTEIPRKRLSSQTSCFGPENSLGTNLTLPISEAWRIGKPPLGFWNAQGASWREANS